MIIQVTVFGSLHPDNETILQTGITCTFLMLPLPAGEGWGGGPKAQIVTVGSIYFHIWGDLI